MLRIKKEVDLKELEKFGFKKRPAYLMFGDEQECCLYIEQDRNICIYCVTTCIDADIEDYILDKLYDLIQAGYVEKVEE